MRTYFVLWWLLLLLTFVPALMGGLLYSRKMADLTWQKGLVAGLAGGFVGIACSMAWYWFTNLIPGSEAIIVGYLMLPIPSAWIICHFWQRRSIVW